MIINVSDYTREAIEKGIGKETDIEFFIHAIFKEQIANSNTIEIKTGKHGPGTQISKAKYFQEIKNALRLVDCGDFHLRYQGAQKTKDVITWRLKVDMKKKSSQISPGTSSQKPKEKKKEITTEEIIEHMEHEKPVVVEVDKEEMKGMIEESGTPPSYFVPRGGRKDKKKKTKPKGG